MSYEYTAELQLEDGSLVQVDLEERGWAEPERLSLTRVFTLVPKSPGGKWPFVRVHIPEGAKPVFKSRVNKTIGKGSEASALNFRAYAVGYFKDGATYWTWVFPNGTIEQNTDAPTFNDILVKAMNDARAALVAEEKRKLEEAKAAAENEGMIKEEDVVA
jgi:hypothetical protein